MMKVLKLLLLIIAGPLTTLAQGSFEVRLFSEENGLNGSYVVGARECVDGRLMVATKQGVSITDGRVFTPILHDSMPIGNVGALHCTGDAMLLGLSDGNIIQWNRLSTRLIETGLEEQIMFISGFAESGVLAVSRLGRLFIRQGDRQVIHPLSGEELLVNTVLAPHPYMLYVGTNEGLFHVKLDKEGKPTAVDQCASVPATRILSLGHDPSNDLLYIGTEDVGLLKMKGAHDHRSDAMEVRTRDKNTLDDVQSIMVDDFGRIWLGVANLGLRVLVCTKGDNEDYSLLTVESPVLQQHHVHDIVQDSEGTIWVSTFGGGLVQVLDRIFYSPFDADWLRQQRITRLFEDSDKQVWIGIDKGVFLTEPHDNGTEFKYFHIGGNAVTSISQGSDGVLWISTAEHGLYRKPAGTDRFSHIELPDGRLSNSVNKVVPLDNDILVCTKGGLYILDRNAVIKKRYTTIDGLPHNNVIHALRDRHGNTWMAIQGNRVAFLKDGQVRFLEEGDARSIADVHNILEDRKGRLWFATLGSGVFVLSEGQADHISEADGMPSSYCYQLIEDSDGNIWVRHQKALSQISQDLSVTRVIGHQHLSPVANTMITYLFRDKEDNIWVTSTHGAVRYDTKMDKAGRSAPKLSITGMRVGDRPTKMTDRLKLPYGKYSINFDVSGVSLRNPESIRYRYRLLGFSDVWSEETSSSNIQFPRLEDGEYTLEVIANKNGGEWTPEPSTFSFYIAKPIWLSWPFIIMCIVVTVASVGGFIRYRTVKLLADKEALEKVVSERTVEIQQQKHEIEQSRDEIARYAKDITDSIKYAQRIQAAIFPEWDKENAAVENSFVFFRSKDIVSGDFFFAERVGDLRIFAAVDCTGHGVPGGFMSIVANNLLVQAVKQVGLTSPAKILDYLNKGVTNTLHQTYEESSVKDGLDISLCTLNVKTGHMEFAGAYNPLYVFRDGQLNIYRGDRFPVGMFVGEEVKSFTNNVIQTQPGDMIYLFSDGYSDQFGGPKGKKLKLFGFRNLLEEIHQLPVEEQEQILALKLNEWQGDLEQVDDIVVMGVRIA